jgi:hypothetical protein
MKWEPIVAGRPDVRGIHPRYSGLLEIVIPLNFTPPEEWTKFFENPSGVSISSGMHPPHVSGDEVFIRPPDTDIDEYVNHVILRIKAANEWYEREMVPRIVAEESAVEEKRNSEAERIESARRRFENTSPNPSRSEGPPSAASPGAGLVKREPTTSHDKWDVFISHASEDKKDTVEPLASRLHAHGLRVWYDKAVLKLGDSLLGSIDAGLAQSRFGVVVLSPAFFKKAWPRKELDGLVAREISKGRKVILPIWHNVTHEDVVKYSPTLAGRVAALSKDGLDEVVRQIIEVFSA